MEAVQYRKKKEDNIQLLHLYQRLIDLQESCWTKLFRFEKSDYFIQFQKKYSVPGIINIRLDDFIYLLLLGIQEVIFGVLPMSSLNPITTPYRQSLALFFLTSFVAIISPHWFKWLTLAFFCIGYPALIYVSFNGYISLMPIDSSIQLFSYLGYMSLLPILLYLLLIYPLKQFIRNLAGSIYSYIYGLSITLILYLWPLYSFINELSSTGTLGTSFITSNTPLITAFIILVVTGLYFFIHHVLFQPKIERVQELLLQDFSSGQLAQAMQQLEQLQMNKKSVVYGHFHLFVRSMSFIIYSITLAIQIYLFYFIVNNTSEMLTIGIIMGYILIFLLLGAAFIYIKVSPVIALPIAAILSLGTAIPSLFYYKSSVNSYTYFFISLSGPFLAFFWSLIKNISKKAIIFRTNAIIALYVTIFLPVITLTINSYKYFTTDTSITTVINYILFAIIGLTVTILLVLFVIWEVSKHKVQSQSEQKAKVAVDYNYFEEGNPQYKYYEVDQKVSVSYFVNLDFRQISYISGMCFFIFSELLSIHAINLLNNQFSSTLFYSSSINQIIYSSFTNILVFYLYTHCFLANPDGNVVRNIFFVIFAILAVGCFVVVYMTNYGSTTFKIIGGFNIIMIALLIALQAIKNAAQKIFGFVATIIVIALWIFIILPYVQIIPFTSLFADQTNFGTFIFICIVGSVVLLIFLVGILTLIFNRLIDKFQEQKKYKFVMEDVVSLFAEQGVEAQDEQLHILYQSFMYRDKKYVFFLKRGYPVNLLQDPDDKVTKLVTSEDYGLKRIPTKKQMNTQDQKKKSCLWMFLTCCCGQDEEQIQQKITKAKKLIDKQELQSLLPNILAAALIKNDKQKIKIGSKKKKKWKKPSEVYSSKSLILKDLQPGPRFLGDEYILLKTSKNADLAIEIWHNIFDFAANKDEGEPLIISNDFKSLIEIAKIDISPAQIDKIFFQLAKKKWGEYNAMDLESFSIIIEFIAENIYPGAGEEGKFHLLIEVAYYNLSVYQQFNHFMVEKRTKDRVSKKQIKSSPFKNSLQKYQSFLISKRQQQATLVKKVKKNDNDKQILLQQQIIEVIEKEQEKIQKGPSCKKIIFDKVKACQKCCKKEQKSQDFERKLFVRPWNIVSVDAVKIMEKKQNDWDSVVDLKEHPFRPTSNNILMAVLKILDLYSYLSLSIMNPQIGWLSNLNSSNLYFDYKIQTYIAMVIVGISVPLGIKGIMLIFQDRLGLTQNRLPAAFPHPMFFFTFIYKLMILSFFNIVSQTFLDTFNCNWTATAYVYTLVDDSSIECFSDYHTKIALASLLCIIAYYPLSSYAMPNFQFAQKSLDLKYRPSFLILYFQVHFVQLASKVLLSGSNLSSTIQIINISINIFSLFILGFSVYSMKPCFIIWFNWVELSIILVGLTVHTMGLVLYITGQWTLCVIIAGAICVAIVIITFIFIKKSYFSRQVSDQVEANIDNVKQLEMMWNYKQKKAKLLISLDDKRNKNAVKGLMNVDDRISEEQNTQQLLQK